MLTVGITGTLGAGKGTVVERLKEKGFAHYSSRSFIVDEIESRGMPVNRDSMRVVANDMRKKNGSGVIADELYKRALADGRDRIIIESLRNTGEVGALRTKGSFYLFAVNADPKKRYERIYKRSNETDQISYGKFIFQEEREMRSSDKISQNIAGCMAAADYKIINNGTFKELRAQVDKALEEIYKQEGING